MKGSIVPVRIAALVLPACVGANTQELPKNLPAKEQLANDNELFISLATKSLKWDEPAEGYRRFIAGKRRAFEDEVDTENGVATSPSN